MAYANTYIVSSAPTSYPISLTEAKEHLRITDTTEDTLIESLIQASTEYCEIYENRKYCNQTIVACYDSFDSKLILPCNPVQSISSITYIDDNEVEQTLDSSLYTLDNYSCPSFVYISSSASLPTVNSDYPNPVRVTYEAGYESNPSSTDSIPARVKASIKLILGALFENRENFITGTITSEIPFSAKCLLNERVFI